MCRTTRIKIWTKIPGSMFVAFDLHILITVVITKEIKDWPSNICKKLLYTSHYLQNMLLQLSRYNLTGTVSVPRLFVLYTELSLTDSTDYLYKLNSGGMSHTTSWFTNTGKLTTEMARSADYPVEKQINWLSDWRQEHGNY